MASGAKHSYGSQLKIGDGAGPEVFTAIAEVQKISASGIKLDALETTNLASPDGYREFVGGLLDGGEISLSLKFLPDLAGHAALVTDQNAKTLRNFEWHIPTTTAKKFSFAALITSISIDTDVEKVIEAEVTLKISGKPTLASV